MKCKSSYLSLLASGELELRVQSARVHLASCDVCPLGCRVNRLADGKGLCQTGRLAQISSYGSHHGEEKPISGWRGSGTIFFSHCNLRCVFCQNYDISQMGVGEEISGRHLASIMLCLQDMGCHNINLVSPSHVIPQILEAVQIAARAGLNLPLVYNSGGYDSLEMLGLLDGVIDIYMPDMKFSNEDIAYKYSGISDYPTINQTAVREMHRQVGDLRLDEGGIAIRGLLVRHLVLPNNLAGTKGILHFLANSVSRNVYLNLMDQYHPCYHAAEYPELNRRISAKEYDRVIQLAQNFGLTRLDHN